MMATLDGTSEHPYDRHVGRYGQQLAAGLIDVAGVRSGDRVLDVGCGTGQLSMELAEIVGGENLAAIDPGEAVVAVCRRRVPDADVRVGVAEALPFADATFDAVLAQLVINLVDDPAAAVGEMVRVARPGASVAACLWDDDEMPLLRSYWDAAQEAAPAELAEVNDGARVGAPDKEWLRELWEAAGLGDITVGDFSVTADYEDFDDLFFSFAAGVGHSGGLYVSLDPDRQAALRASAHRRLGSPKGAFQLTARVRTVLGITARSE
jgi:SAM-dependent methyltransferase